MCLVSVVVPYYNSQDTLRRTLDSIRSQTLRDFEIITVNDGSKDESLSVVQQFAADYPDIRLKNIDQRNGGPSKARNRGMEESRGKYIAFLDSDDTWEPDKLELQIAYMEAHPEMVITGTNYFVNAGEMLKYALTPDVVEADFYRMLFKVFYCMSTVMVRRDIVMLEHYRFLEGKNYGEDLLFFQQIIRKYRGARISKPLAAQPKFLYGVSGLSGNLAKCREHELDNIRILYRENNKSGKKIGKLLYYGLILYSELKHVVRLYKSRKYAAAKREGERA